MMSKQMMSYAQMMTMSTTHRPPKYCQTYRGGERDFRQTMHATETTVSARLFVHTVARPASKEKMKHPMTTDTNSSKDGAMDVNM